MNNPGIIIGFNIIFDILLRRAAIHFVSFARRILFREKPCNSGRILILRHFSLGTILALQVSGRLQASAQPELKGQIEKQSDQGHAKNETNKTNNANLKQKQKKKSN